MRSFRALVNVITEIPCTKRRFIFASGIGQGNYPAVFSSSPLDDKNFLCAGSAPLSTGLSHDSCLLLRDFPRTVEYKSMWEEENTRWRS